jgi:hypothetical protein
MNADHDKQNELQKMLASKKHEAPPPRFSHGFSETVIDRLQHPESPGEQTFSERFIQAMESKPVLVCLSGVVVFACLAVGLVASLRVSPPKADQSVSSEESKFVVAPPPSARMEAAPQLGRLDGRRSNPSINSPAVVSESFPTDGSRFQPPGTSSAVMPVLAEPVKK